MTNTISFHLSEEQLRQECMEFFDANLKTDQIELNSYIQSLSVEQFNSWFGVICEKYYSEIYKHIKDLAIFIRNGYDPLNADSCTTSDPLQQEPAMSMFKRYKTIVSDVSADRLENLTSVIEQRAKLKLFHEAQQKEKLHTVEVEGQTFHAVAMCDVLWSGWECDPYAWVVNQDGINRLVVTDHGSPHFADVSFLEERIQAYKNAIEQSEKMLALLQREHTQAWLQ